MSRNTLIIIAIIIQLIVLASFVVRYETLKQTGTTVYIPVELYDPTDLLRGDYVSLSYELPYSGSTREYSSERQYIVPEMQGNMITKIENITTTKPASGIYFQIRNGGNNQKEAYTMLSSSGTILRYDSRSCMGDDYKVGDSVYYPYYDTNPTIFTITKDAKNTDSNWRQATIITKSACTDIYRFQTTATDRFFVREGSGADLESQIREGEMYAEWRVGNNGAEIITNIIPKQKLPN